MRREHLLFEPILIDHNLKVDIYIFTTSLVVADYFLLVPLHFLHLHPSLLSLLLDTLDLIQGIACLLFRISLHTENVIVFKL